MHKLPPRTPGKRAGFGLLETMLLLALLTTVIIGGYLYIHHTETSRIARQQAALLQQAERQVKAFVVDNYRLPCPDTDNDGVEDCSSNAVVGRLPYKTLGLDGGQINTGVNQLRYQVVRSTYDLAASSNAFEPHDWEGTSFAAAEQEDEETATTYTFNHTNTTDFCTNAFAAAKAGYTRAYAIAAPGAVDADGDGSLFDGDNTGSTALASATQGGSSSYDDHVISVSPTELLIRSGCAVVNDSLNGIALAVSVTNEVADQKAETLENVENSISDTKIQLATQTIALVLGGVDVIQSGIDLAESAAALSGAIASCVVLVGCALIPVYTTATVLSAAALVASAAAVIAQGVSYAQMYSVLSDYNTLASKIGAETATVDLTNTIATLKTASDSAQAKADTAESSYETAKQDAEKAANSLASAKTALENEVTQYKAEEGYENAGIDDLLETVETAAATYAEAQYTEQTAENEVDAYETKIESLQSQIDSLEEKMATITDSKTLASYQTKLDEYNTTMAEYEQAYSDAKATVTAAENNVTTAGTAYSTAVSNLTEALGKLDACVSADCTSTVSADADAYQSAYYSSLSAADNAETLRQTAEDAQTSADEALAEYQTMVNYASSGTTTSEVSLFSDAEDILDAADAKGVAQ